jgi:lipoyl-dependent peroxiredoxin
MTAKTLFMAKTHTTGGPNGASHSMDGQFDIQLPEPHPSAERLFATAWSACFIGAIELAAARKKIALLATPAIDATIDLLIENNAFSLRARLDVSVPGVDREIARELVDAAHGICPYSRATRGNIDVELNVA